mmetsp:Transcript_41273/g.86189  ORF Transcript_41273/g.86189 Transcript_41273/m.86189 type:complete len:238 (+) Transcript_41273:121-834(+)
MLMKKSLTPEAQTSARGELSVCRTRKQPILFSFCAQHRGLCRPTTLPSIRTDLRTKEKMPRRFEADPRRPLTMSAAVVLAKMPPSKSSAGTRALSCRTKRPSAVWKSTTAAPEESRTRTTPVTSAERKAPLRVSSDRVMDLSCRRSAVAQCELISWLLDSSTETCTAGLVELDAFLETRTPSFTAISDDATWIGAPVLLSTMTPSLTVLERLSTTIQTRAKDTAANISSKANWEMSM